MHSKVIWQDFPTWCFSNLWSYYTLFTFSAFIVSDFSEDNCYNLLAIVAPSWVITPKTGRLYSFSQGNCQNYQRVVFFSFYVWGKEVCCVSLGVTTNQNTSLGFIFRDHESRKDGHVPTHNGKTILRFWA